MAKAEKIKIPVNVDINPGKAANATIALNQAIESFSYEERNCATDWQRRLEGLDKEATSPDEKDPQGTPAMFDKFFDENTARIVKRAEAFWAFLESA